MAGQAVRFVALRAFDWIDDSQKLRASYVAGMTYTAREGDTWDDLRKQIPVWKKDGKIALTGDISSQVSGEGS